MVARFSELLLTIEDGQAVLSGPDKDSADAGEEFHVAIAISTTNIPALCEKLQQAKRELDVENCKPNQS